MRDKFLKVMHCANDLGFFLQVSEEVYGFLLGIDFDMKIRSAGLFTVLRMNRSERLSVSFHNFQRSYLREAPFAMGQVYRILTVPKTHFRLP